MRTIARAVPPRPVLIAAVALPTAAGSLLLQPRTADATVRPVPRRGSPPGPREGSAPDRRAALAPAVAAHRARTATEPHTDPDRAYPRRRLLSPDPTNTADKSLKLGLTPYHALAPRLNSLQRLGDRVSVEVAGVSAGGHRLYLVTVTAPETTRQATDQERMRELIENAPATAAKSPEIKSSYKTPVFFDNNIHGNEWEGTDASLTLIEQLATAKDTKTTDLLAHSRLYFNIYFNITANPDGRIAGTRANANGFDLNRDLVTASQPETRAIRAITIDKQPAVLLDLHGYVNGTLIEPTTPPHGENYEYDSAAGLLTARAVEGNEDANGVVRVVNSGPVTAGAPPYGFVYAPVWFTDLGPGVRVEQSYATGNPLIAGHWRAQADGSGGSAAAAGRPSVVSGPRAVLFGTEPLFRDHPKGELPQVGRALFTMAHESSGTRGSGSVEENG